MAAMDSKEAQATLIDPFNEPEPAADTGLNSHFGSTFAGANTTTTASGPTNPASAKPHARSSSNPFRSSPPAKAGASSTARPAGTSSPPTKFPAYRDQLASSSADRPRRSADHAAPPPAYDTLIDKTNTPNRRRTSSLRERYPGDRSHQPLDIIRRDSKKANRAPHLSKRHMPGTDTIDRLDPALGGRAYHHEGPYDAALMSRNNDPKLAPVAALETTNAEAIKATPRENIKDAVERHKPLDGTAVVPPGQPDRLGRTYEYEEGTDMMREGFQGEPGYKRWGGKDYDPEDLKGEGNPSFTLDRALQAHKIRDDDGGIEMQDRAGLMKAYHKKERDGSLDNRDPTRIAGDDAKYVDLQRANDTDLHKKDGRERSGSLREGLKRRIGSLRRKHDD